MDPIAETHAEVERSEKVEQLINEFLGPWDEAASDDVKTMVVGNLRGFASFLVRKGIATLVLLLACVAVNAQTTEEPKVCISQAAANQCAANTRERDALREEVKTLKEVISSRDKTIENLKETNRQNVADLTERLNSTEIKLAETAGELKEAKANINRVLMMNEFLLKNGRNKCGGLTIFCIQ